MLMTNNNNNNTKEMIENITNTTLFRAPSWHVSRNFDKMGVLRAKGILCDVVLTAPRTLNSTLGIVPLSKSSTSSSCMAIVGEFAVDNNNNNDVTSIIPPGGITTFEIIRDIEKTSKIHYDENPAPSTTIIEDSNRNLMTKNIDFGNTGSSVERGTSTYFNDPLIDLPPAHKIVLAACSDYFAAMFSHDSCDLVESNSYRIVIRGVEAHILCLVVDYMYTGCIELREETVEKVLATANILQLPELVEACSDFFIERLNPSNCCGIRAFADNQSCNRLYKMSEDFIIDHFLDVVKSREFGLLPFDQIITILKSDDLNVICEESVYLALLKWVRHDTQERKKHLHPLLNTIRLSRLSPQFICENIQNDSLYFDEPECQRLIMDALLCLLIPMKRFTSFPSQPQHAIPEVHENNKLRARKGTLGIVVALGGMDINKSSTGLEIFDYRKNIWYYYSNSTGAVNAKVTAASSISVGGNSSCNNSTAHNNRSAAWPIASRHNNRSSISCSLLSNNNINHNHELESNCLSQQHMIPNQFCRHHHPHQQTNQIHHNLHQLRHHHGNTMTMMLGPTNHMLSSATAVSSEIVRLPSSSNSSNSCSSTIQISEANSISRRQQNRLLRTHQHHCHQLHQYRPTHPYANQQQQQYIINNINNPSVVVLTNTSTTAFNKRLQFGAVFCEGKIYVIGGRDGLKTLSSVECYDVLSMTPPQSCEENDLNATLTHPPYPPRTVQSSSSCNLNSNFDSTSSYNTGLACSSCCACCGINNSCNSNYPFLSGATFSNAPGIIEDSGLNDDNDVRESLGNNNNINSSTLSCSVRTVTSNDVVGLNLRSKNVRIISNSPEPCPGMITPRHGLGIAVMGGMIYAVGGHDGWSYLNTVERYDPISKTWSFVAQMDFARSTVGVVALGNKLYAIGGRDGNNILKSVECYDLHRDKWTRVASMNEPRSCAGVAAAEYCGSSSSPGGSSLDGMEKSLSSYNAFRYGPDDGKRTTTNNNNKRNLLENANLLPNYSGSGTSTCVVSQIGHIYVAGGHKSSHKAGNVLSSVERYDPQRDTWTYVKKMNVPRDAVALCTIGPDRLIAVGGYDGHSYVKSVELYDAFTNEWNFVASLNSGRAGTCLVRVPPNLTPYEEPYGISSLINDISNNGASNATNSSSNVRDVENNETETIVQESNDPEDRDGIDFLNDFHANNFNFNANALSHITELMDDNA